MYIINSFWEWGSKVLSHLAWFILSDFRQRLQGAQPAVLETMAVVTALTQMLWVHDSYVICSLPQSGVVNSLEQPKGIILAKLGHEWNGIIFFFIIYGLI